MGRACGMWHLWETGEVYTVLWCGDLKEKEHIKSKWDDNIKMDNNNNNNNNTLLTASGLSPDGSGYFTFKLRRTY
jgi:hypothetical protein